MILINLALLCRREIPLNMAQYLYPCDIEFYLPGHFIQLQ